MSKNELIARIEALNEWEAIIEEAQAQADAIRNSIKEELADRGVEELIADINACSNTAHHCPKIISNIKTIKGETEHNNRQNYKYPAPN